MDTYQDTLIRIAKMYDINLEITDDLDKLMEAKARIGLRPIQLFNPREGLCRKGDAFWIKGTSGQGQVVHAQAFRYHEPECNLAQHFKAAAKWYLPPGLEVRMELSRFSLAPAMQTIAGRLAYHGEIWLHPSRRGKGLAAVLPRFGLVEALRRWRPDYFWGLVKTTLIYKGIGAQYGYFHQEPGAAEWSLVDQAQPFYEWLVWNRPNDVEFLMQRGEMEGLLQASDLLAPPDTQIHRAPLHV